ncbi:MAG: response regulator [Nitrospira sp.]|nr:response regulator [Nitrospira sp.]
MPRILVTDDDASVRRMVCRTLELAGFIVDEAPDGKVGLALFKKNPANLAVVDLFMPEKDGIETIMELKRTQPDVKIIAMTDGGQSGLISLGFAALALGADRVLSKPFQHEALLNTVLELLSMPPVEQEIDPTA